MKILKVPGMMCQMCVNRINKGFSEASIEVQVDLASKTVKVSADSVEKAKDILDDLGFDAEEIKG